MTWCTSVSTGSFVVRRSLRSNTPLLRAAAQDGPASPRVRPPQKRSTLGAPIHGEVK